jgi:hypothetical protein
MLHPTAQTSSVSMDAPMAIVNEMDRPGGAGYVLMTLGAACVYAAIMFWARSHGL